ncbi:hypothetical protein [Pinibacter soli]|uniref:SWIM-type domain-containing protein n=1 Tax=Pinibacter soli TaxID=3044211 RepID=A0ABT6RHB8_9BACT|nr:hypothetical protein [Pinibacter soli]MDI3321971.1 hypothetical protein [Pinibacter soli]
MKRGSKNNLSTYCVALQKGGRLSTDELQKRTGYLTFRSGWSNSSLKFLSFEKNILTLRTTSDDETYVVQLRRKQNQLFLTCSCNKTGQQICKHAYCALDTILWKNGQDYFKKLHPSGMMELAFRYPMLFDKQETESGITVTIRPELKSVFYLSPKIKTPDINAIINLPDTGLPSCQELPELDSKFCRLPDGKAIAYMLVIPYRYEHLPSIIPVTGTPTVKDNALKSFDSFQSSLKTISRQFQSPKQGQFHEECFELYRQIERLPGALLEGKLYAKKFESLSPILKLWRSIYPYLLGQPFFYSYILLGPKALRTKPRRNYLQQIFLSAAIPVISFLLSDKGDHFRFSLQVHIDGKQAQNIETGIPLFIKMDDFVFPLGSLRDACLVEWIDRSGGWITIFKEHFSLFEKEVLTPLQTCYTVSFVKQ